MKDVLGSLPEVITAYKNYNLLVPTATDVQLNPFYKFHVEEVPVDLGENSGDIFKVGSVKTGEKDERGKDIWEDVFSLSKPLLNKMAMAAGIQFNPKETYGERIDRVTYRAQAQGAMRKADGTARTETDQKVICLEDEEEKYRIEFADKATKGITDEKQAQAAAEIFSGQWVESKNKWGKKCQAFVVAKEDRDRYIDRSVMVNMALLKKTWAEKAMTGAKLRVIRALLGVKGTSGAENRRDYRQKRIIEIKQQEEFMKNSGCPDIESASCRFLSKAVEDVKSLPVELDNLKKCEEEIEILTSERDKKIADKQEEIERIGYDPKRLAILTASVTELSKYERIKKAVEQNKLEIARLEAEKESNDKNIGQCEENLLQVKSKASEITETVNELSESVDRQEQIKQQMAHLQTYVEQEKELPVYEERKQHVLERIESMEKERERLTDRKFILSSQLTGMDTMLEKMKETFSTNMVEETDRQIRSNKETLGELQIKKGVLLERLENIDTMRDEISMLNNGIAVTAGRADCYEALKQAFSQDGVPHQIIRNIIPHITDTTNNILGQMTGGTMGVEFVMERTVKGKDGDKATLDVLINEYGKTTLPYASKSGGEKVKASLAVILALSEIKATAAGIQLGMLFIDEPPFLDDEGTQAYVDALETIRNRYSDVKIMAITHDDAMKARFGQAVTVIKTDDGSKVIY